MPARERRSDAGDDLAALTHAYAAIVDEARAHVAARRDFDADALEAQIRAAARRQRSRHPAKAAAIDRAEGRALEQLERIVRVHRARARLDREPAEPAAAAPAPPRAPRRHGGLRTRPTITGNMSVRHEWNGEAAVLRWDPEPGVETWEVRISRRPDVRSDYVAAETRTLPGTATEAELPLDELPLRVHLLGRSRSGRLLRRVIVSALTRDNWSDRWQRRPSAP